MPRYINKNGMDWFKEEPRLETCNICGKLLPWYQVCQDVDFCENYWEDPEETSEEN